MKKIVILCLILGAFSLGYFFASKAMLTTAFVETNSNVISRSFSERSSLYKLLRRNQNEKAEKTLEALIFGDLMAIGEINFSNTSNFELLCRQLKELQSVSHEENLFSAELEKRVKACE